MAGLIGSLVKKLLTLVADPKSSWNGLRWVGVVLADEVALELKFDNLQKIIGRVVKLLWVLQIFWKIYDLSFASTETKN